MDAPASGIAVTTWRTIQHISLSTSLPSPHLSSRTPPAICGFQWTHTKDEHWPGQQDKLDHSQLSCLHRWHWVDRLPGEACWVIEHHRWGLMIVSMDWYNCLFWGLLQHQTRWGRCSGEEWRRTNGNRGIISMCTRKRIDDGKTPPTVQSWSIELSLDQSDLSRFSYRLSICNGSDEGESTSSEVGQHGWWVSGVVICDGIERVCVDK